MFSPGLDRPLGWQPSRFLADRAEAERAFTLAERLGSVNAAASQRSGRPPQAWTRCLWRSTPASSRPENGHRLSCTSGSAARSSTPVGRQRAGRAVQRKPPPPANHPRLGIIRRADRSHRPADRAPAVPTAAKPNAPHPPRMNHSRSRSGICSPMPVDSTCIGRGSGKAGGTGLWGKRNGLALGWERFRARMGHGVLLRCAPLALGPSGRLGVDRCGGRAGRKSRSLSSGTVVGMIAKSPLCASGILRPICRYRCEGIVA
jgi:hypothetical protein